MQEKQPYPFLCQGCGFFVSSKKTAEPQSLDKAIRVQWFFSAKQRDYLGFIALQSEYAGILRLGTAPLKDVVCRKSSTGNKKIFSF